MISRRGFFGLLSGAVAIEVIRPKIYVFAPPNGWTAGTSGILTEAAVSAVELEAFTTKLEDLFLPLDKMWASYKAKNPPRTPFTIRSIHRGYA